MSQLRIIFFRLSRELNRIDKPATLPCILSEMAAEPHWTKCAEILHNLKAIQCETFGQKLTESGQVMER